MDNQAGLIFNVYGIFMLTIILAFPIAIIVTIIAAITKHTRKQFTKATKG